MPLETGPEVARAFGFYAVLLENWMERLRGATRDAQLGDYSPRAVASDAVASWRDTVSAVLFPWTLIAPFEVKLTTPTAKVSFTVGTEDELFRVVRVANPGGKIVADPLQDTAATGASIPAANIDLSLLEDGRFLAVRLHGLTALALAPGSSYECLVHPVGASTPIVAQIHVDKV
jgi:hypothetical protein